MSFGTGGSLFSLSDVGAAWTLWDSIPEATESGWDRLRARYVKDYGATTKQGHQVAAEFGIGEATVSGQNFWTVGIQPVQLGANIWACDLVGHGILESRPIKVRGRSGVEQQQGTGDIPGHIGVRALVLESAPTVEISYVQVGGLPPTDLVGLAGTPAFVPAVRSSVFTGITNPLYHYPYGWVFMDIDWDMIPGGAAYLITEIWAYIFEKSI